MKTLQMRLGSAWVVLAASAAVFAGACTESGDIGYPCVLVKSDGDGGTTPLLNGDIEPNRDVVSFGSVECEKFICIRHRFAELPADADPAAPAAGTCSRPCVPTNAQACAAVYGEADFGDGPFTCRALVLDEETLADVCDDPNPPPICGITRQANFCAQGAQHPDAKGLDAGT